MNAQAGPSVGAYGGGHELEQHNDDLLSGLLGKVNTLKDVSLAGWRRQMSWAEEGGMCRVERKAGLEVGQSCMETAGGLP